MIHVNFRENWWKHWCYITWEAVWKHNSYNLCSDCKCRHIGAVIKGKSPL